MTEHVKRHRVEEPKAPPKKILVRPVYGRMVNLHTSQEIGIDGVTEVPEIDSWLQAQIDAGKIVVV